ncbi:putative Non-specific protein-tyrosine kinase [Gigaspora margarita]|uniref:Putative Non-specific protein-tyrosine kinase n=1 Tax=Gigaspora margarita TaxID=4874 RepID=A0A8H4EQL6_GIGMA|nr:putative Non-specific protein-tyrosine kinase [Gigaspora margarita]
MDKKINMGQKKRTIILIGKTGNGKSTLANVLVNDENEQFKESSSGDSETKEYKSVSFSNDEFEYTVIDIPGLSDTGIGNEKVVYEQTVRAVCSAKNGLNQILFITKDRFTKEVYDAYMFLKNAFFNKHAINFVTIIRTNFPYFKDNKKCKDDMNKATGHLAKVIKECEGRVIHVDNPPINVSDPDEIEYHKKKRKASRDILLEHLSKCDDTYFHEVQPISNETIIQLHDIKEDLKEYKHIMSKLHNNIQASVADGNKFKNFGEWTLLGSTLNMDPAVASLAACSSILARLRKDKKERDFGDI